MRVPEPPNDERISRLARAWLTATMASEQPPDWVEDETLGWRGRGDFGSLWRFVLRLCDDVADDDTEAIEQIGVDPLWTLVNYWPDAALAAIEEEADTQPKLLGALSIVIPPSHVAGSRIEAILAQHGQGPD
jgi:hypothetical protein